MKTIQETPTIEIKLIEEVGDLDNLEVGDYISLDGPAGLSTPAVFLCRDGINPKKFSLAATIISIGIPEAKPIGKVDWEFEDKYKFPIQREITYPFDEQSAEYIKCKEMLEAIFQE